MPMLQFACAFHHPMMHMRFLPNDDSQRSDLLGRAWNHKRGPAGCRASGDLGDAASSSGGAA
jgi:hypothetical protein